jgi:hypothetical protein
MMNGKFGVKNRKTIGSPTVSTKKIARTTLFGINNYTQTKMTRKEIRDGKKQTTLEDALCSSSFGS